MNRLIILAVLLPACASTYTEDTVKDVSVAATDISSMMDQAERCKGIVKFQAELSHDETRARFTCEWTTEKTDEWW